MRTRTLWLNAVLLLFLLLPGTGQITRAALSETDKALTRLPQGDSADLDVIPIAANVSETLRNSPVMFIENVGQFDEGARFQVRGGNGTLWLADDSLWITIVEHSAVNDQRPAPLAYEQEQSFDQNPKSQVENRQTVNLRLSFLNANPHPRLEPFDRLETTVSYFIGNDPDGWQPVVPVWGGVRYVDLYPGIDLEVTSEGEQFVQRLRAQPGADLSQVQLRVEGAETVGLAGTEGLHLSTTIGDYILPLLKVSDTTLDASPFVSAKGARTFDVTTPLILSPFYPINLSVTIQNQDNSSCLVYGTLLGGSSWDHGTGIVVDGMGNAYITGFTGSTDFPTVVGPDLTYNTSDAFVAKVNVTGTALIYAGFLGGSGSDNGTSIAVDGEGNTYVSGYTASANFPTAGGLDPTHNGGYYDAFVVKVNAAGTELVYAGFLGGSSDDQGWGITVDNEGNAYVTGPTQSADFPVLVGPDLTHNGDADAFIVKVNAAGTGFVYTGFLGGSIADYSRGIVVDGAGNAYVTGYTESTDFPATIGPDLTYNGGDRDGFIAKVNAAGDGLAYAGFLGGSSSESSMGITVDNAGNAYVTGPTQSIDFPALVGPDLTHNGNYDVFVAKVNAAGTGFVYTGFLGGSNNDQGNSVTVDDVGNAYVTGYTESTDFPATIGLDLTYNGGDRDGFIAKVNAAGDGLAYAGFLGGSSSENNASIAVDTVGNAYITGGTSSTDFPTTPDTFDTTHNGDWDAFVVKLREDNEAQVRLTGIEVTQAIQNLMVHSEDPEKVWENPTLLVQGKRTFVRAHVQSATSWSVSDVTARLHGKHADGTPLPGSPLLPSNVNEYIDVKALLPSPQRSQLNDSFYFALPLSWASGDVELEFEGVSHSVFCNENAEPNPNDCRVSVSFVDTPKLKLRLIPVTWHELDGTLHKPEFEDLLWVALAVKTMYPVHDVDWDSPYEIVRALPGPYDRVLIELNLRLAELKAADQLRGSYDSNRIYVGVLVDYPGGLLRAAGLGNVPAGVASGYWIPGDPGILPHEIGHVLDRKHTLCGGGEFDPGLDYPYKYGHISNEIEGDAAFYGFNTHSQKIFPPWTGDLMSYCRPMWPSRYTYELLHSEIVKRFGLSAERALAEIDPEPALMISGVITPAENIGNIHAVYVMDSGVSQPLPEPGAYEIRLLDSSGQILVSYPFEPSVEVPDPGMDCESNDQELLGGFALALPWNLGAVRIELAHGTALLDAVVGSTHMPSVTVLSPNGGEYLSGSNTTITWSANDVDGDILDYVIQYSTDFGVSWMTLVSNWPFTEYELALDFVSGTDQGLIRILASDGFHTDQDQSDGVFSVAKHAPRVNIEYPSNDELYIGDQLLFLEGRGFDNEDGELEDESLTWSSNLDGVLDTGRSLTVAASALNEGIHTITLTAQDNDDQTSTANVDVQVSRLPVTLPPDLAVAPSVIEFTGIPGINQTSGQVLSVRNDGDGELTWSAQADQTWITLSSVQGVAPSDSIVIADTTGLVSGEYRGSIVVTTSEAVNSPQTVTVTLRVPHQSYVYLPLVLHTR